MELVNTQKKIIESFKRNFPYQFHHTESMHIFVQKHLKLIVQSFSPIISTIDDFHHELHFKKVVVKAPEFTSQNCKLRRKSFLFSVSTDILQVLYNKNSRSERFHKDVKICELPAMIGTIPCVGEDLISHARGCFIINGNLKCILSQEALISNFPIITRKDSKISVAVRSLFYMKFKSSSTVYFESNVNDRELYMRLPSIKHKESVLMMLKTLGFSFEETQVEEILFFFPKLDAEFYDKVEIHEKYIDEFLPHCFLPNSSEQEIRQKKIYFTLLCLRKLRTFILDETLKDDIDNLLYKSFVPPGHLYALVFRQRMKTFIKTTQFYILKILKKTTLPVIDQIFPENNSLSAAIHYAFATGNWGANSIDSNAHGVSQICNQTNVDTWISQMRLVNIPLSRDGKTPYPRQLNISYYGTLCANDTPEGRSAGLINSLTTFTYIQPELSLDIIFYIIKQHFHRLKFFTHSENKPLMQVYIHGIYVGAFTNTKDKIEQFHKKFTALKENYALPPTISYDRNDTLKYIYIFTQAGRTSRPMFVASKLKQLCKFCSKYNVDELWRQLILHGFVQYMSKSLETFYKIGPNYLRPQKEYKFYEIHPFLFMHGILASKIPFSNHNQSPRNIYQSNMGKQSVGAIMPYYTRNANTENKQFYLDYPQIPLVQTISHELLSPIENNLNGVNCVVAIMAFSGYNQEDSILINKASLDRGLFRTSFHRLYNTKETSSGNLMDKFMSVKDTKDLKVIKSNGDYSLVQNSMCAQVGDVVKNNDIIIHKVRMSKYTRNNNIISYKDCAVVAESPDDMRVNRVELCNVTSEEKGITVHCISNRVPELGDKLSSRHGQKGIIGMIFPPQDLPRTHDGIIPDIIINTCAIPSRMTIGQIIESVKARKCCMIGRGTCGQNGDATAFTHESIDMQHILKDYKACNLNRNGEETFYCGRTGKKLRNKCFMGICYYQRLKHFVQDKIHARAGSGAVDFITQQPVEGRSRKGGLRLGEMERDSLIGHGCSITLQERMVDSSDKLIMIICSKCGFFVDEPPFQTMKGWCRVCMSSNYCERVKVPYAYKLMWQELLSVGVGIKHSIIPTNPKLIK